MSENEKSAKPDEERREPDTFWIPGAGRFSMGYCEECGEPLRIGRLCPPPCPTNPHSAARAPGEK